MSSLTSVRFRRARVNLTWVSFSRGPRWMRQGKPSSVQAAGLGLRLEAFANPADVTPANVLGNQADAGHLLARDVARRGRDRDRQQIDLLRIGFFVDEFFQFRGGGRGHFFAGVEPQDPLAPGVIERHVAGLGETIVPGPRNHPGTAGFRHFGGPIGRAVVDHHDFISQQTGRGQRLGHHGPRVAGNDGHGQTAGGACTHASPKSWFSERARAGAMRRGPNCTATGRKTLEPTARRQAEGRGR